MVNLINKLFGRESILKKDVNGKPILKLISLRNTAVKTQTQEEYDELMKVYELGKWEWNGGNLPTQSNNWEKGEEKTCVGAEDLFAYGNKELYIRDNCQLISTQKFYEMQKITPEMLKEVNELYWEKK